MIRKSKYRRYNISSYNFTSPCNNKFQSYKLFSKYTLYLYAFLSELFLLIMLSCIYKMDFSNTHYCLLTLTFIRLFNVNLLNQTNKSSMGGFFP